MTAELTAVDLAGGNAIELCSLSTIGTFDQFWKPLIADVIQTGIIVREHLHKVFEGEGNHLCFGHLVSPNDQSIAQSVRDVKGYSPYKNLVRLACAQLEPLKKGNHVAIAFTFYRERKSGDLDNRIKVVLDSLNGVFYEDDEQIVDIHAKREDDKENPRIVLEMWKVRNKK